MVDEVLAYTVQVLVLDGNRITHLPDWLGELTKVRCVHVAGCLPSQALLCSACMLVR